MNTRDAVALTGFCASKADAKIKNSEMKSLHALMSLSTLYQDIPDYANYIKELSEKYKELSVEQIIDQVSGELSARMKETAYAWACAVIIADSGIAQKEHVFLSLLVKKFQINGNLAGKIAAIVPMLCREG